ncbi:MAG: hypothetical protein PF549_02225, partial [Patescibacteria group bacterium]|nr:hypothetical protein [Patescibacteria group bacterium]
MLSLNSEKKDACQYSPLVTTPIREPISEFFPLIDSMQFFRTSLKVKRPHPSDASKIEHTDRTGTSINVFSSKSRSRLRFLAVNSKKPLISQFALTYHDKWSEDGREVKRHLHWFLKDLRRICPDIGYLWIMEFQARKAPHFHLFLSIPPSAAIWERLAKIWSRISAPGSDFSEWFHGSERGKNWIPWEMGSASYLAKYLDKLDQKDVPEGFFNFGRFWGNSRNIKPDFLEMSIEDLSNMEIVDKQTGELYGT